jgi:hypothetical protein
MLGRVESDTVGVETGSAGGSEMRVKAEEFEVRAARMRKQILQRYGAGTGGRTDGEPVCNEVSKTLRTELEVDDGLSVEPKMGKKLAICEEA